MTAGSRPVTSGRDGCIPRTEKRSRPEKNSGSHWSGGATLKSRQSTSSASPGMRFSTHAAS
jgi:hypothetical protein